jgi:outer membrane protein OmpA-like peptidoglycan-associated protein
MKDLKFGGRIMNLNEPNPSLSGDEAGKFPRKVRIGLSYNFRNIITPSFDYVMPLSSDVGVQDEATYYMGAESWFYRGMLAARAGYNERGPSFGFSVRKLEGFGVGLDYALVLPSMKGAGLTTHKISLGMGTKIPPPKVIDLAIFKDSISVSPAIFTPDTKGKVRAVISNLKEDTSPSFDVCVYYADSLGQFRVIAVRKMDGIRGNSSEIFEFDWKPPYNGHFELFVSVDDDGSRLPKPNGNISEANEDNNIVSVNISSFYKPLLDGIDIEKTSLEISQVSFVKEELPIIPSVFFSKTSNSIDPRFDRLLKTVAERLERNQNIRLELRGFYDVYTEDSDNSKNLALERAKAVKERLVSFGAPSDKLILVSDGYDMAETKAGLKEKKRPSIAFLEEVAEENRRVELNAVLVGVDSKLAEVSSLSGQSISQGDLTRIDEAISKAKRILDSNPDVDVMIVSGGSYDNTSDFNKVRDLEKRVDEQMGVFLKGRVFGAFTKDLGADLVNVSLSAEPILYKPIAQSNVPEGFRLAEEKGNLISLRNLTISARVDTFYIVVRDESGNTFRSLASGKGEIPSQITWNWRSDAGEPPNPGRTYHIDFYVRDEVGQELFGKSNEITIKSQKMQHIKELVLINFNFSGTTAKSKYIESRIESVAKQIINLSLDPIKSMQVIVGGHSDIIGTEEARLEISSSRAKKEYESLRSYLLKYLDFPDSKALDNWLTSKNITLTHKGYGSNVPFEINVLGKRLLQHNSFRSQRIP